MTATSDLAAEVRSDNHTALLRLLKRFCVTHVVVNFDGGGDSGQIDEIEFTGLLEGQDAAKLQADEIIKTIRRDYKAEPDGSFGFSESVEAMSTAASDKTLHGITEQFAYALLQETNYDWVNNEGGWGTITIIPDNDTITVDMNVRVMSSENYQIEL